jgi:hypothetical protein
MLASIVAGAGVFKPKRMILVSLVGQSLTLLAGIVNIYFIEEFPVEVHFLDCLSALFGGFSKLKINYSSSIELDHSLSFQK